MAQALEEMGEVVSYAKNHSLGFTIPYTLNGKEHNYTPDFIVRIRDPKSDRSAQPLNLIIEVSGEKKKDKAAKVSTTRTLWIPAVNNHGAFGRWAFIEIDDPWDAQNSIREALCKPEIRL
jgi:type III restriction enzyme